MQNEQTNNVETITSNLVRFEERYKTKKKVILQCEGRYQKNTHMWYKHCDLLCFVLFWHCAYKIASKKFNNMPRFKIHLPRTPSTYFFSSFSKIFWVSFRFLADSLFFASTFIYNNSAKLYIKQTSLEFTGNEFL